MSQKFRNISQFLITQIGDIIGHFNQHNITILWLNTYTNNPEIMYKSNVNRSAGHCPIGFCNLANKLVKFLSISNITEITTSI